MSQGDRYVDLDGNEISLASLDAEERKLVNSLKRRAAGKPPWDEFGNFFVKAVGDFYQGGPFCSDEFDASRDDIW